MAHYRVVLNLNPEPQSSNHRALGDFAFKSPQPLLLSQPDVITQHLTTEDTLLMMLSDGVTDVMSDEDVMTAATLGVAKVSRVPETSWSQNTPIGSMRSA